MTGTPRAVVAMVGVGQLGSRHLQGLATSSHDLEIHLVDPSPASLDLALDRWASVKGPSGHRVEVHSRLDNLPPVLDIAIVACSAGERPAVVSSLAASRTVDDWVLEKVLACDVGGLEAIRAATGSADGAWVNTPRRMFDWYRRIGAEGIAGRPVGLEVTGGGWGLACNAVHFLDLAVWWSGSRLVEVDTSGLKRHWMPARREGYLEVEGRLVGRMADGGTVTMEDHGGADHLALRLDTSEGRWEVDEPGGSATRSDGLSVRGRLENQSEVTGRLVDEILETGGCRLPTVDESIAVHGPLLEALLAHRRLTGDPTATTVPIT